MQKGISAQPKDSKDGHSFSHREEFFETMDNSEGKAKRVEVGQVEEQKDQQAPQRQVINEADDMQGHKLTPEQEEDQIRKHKVFFSHFRPFEHQHST